MKPLPKELEEKIDLLKSWMVFDGDQRRVAQIAGVHESIVSNTLNKKIIPNKKVIAAAEEVMEKNKMTCGLQKAS